jgi:hypothetical protein
MYCYRAILLLPLGMLQIEAISFATHNNGFLIKILRLSGCGVVVIIVRRFRDNPCPWQLHDFKRLAAAAAAAAAEGPLLQEHIHREKKLVVHGSVVSDMLLLERVRV